MRSPALLLAARSLRVRARDPWLMVARTGVALALVWGTVEGHARRLTLGAAGPWLLETMCWTNLCLVPLLGVMVMSAPIAEERENRILDLLRLTGMRRWSLLLGHALADLAMILLVLGLEVPFALLAITLGGVSGAQVVVALATLSCHVVFVWGIAAVCSTMAPTPLQAAWWTGTVLAVVIIGALAVEPVGSLLAGETTRTLRWIGDRAVGLGIRDALSAQAVAVPVAALAQLGLGLLCAAVAAARIGSEPVALPSIASVARGLQVAVPRRVRRDRPGRGAAAITWNDFGPRGRRWCPELLWGTYLLAAVLGAAAVVPEPYGWRESAAARAARGAIEWLAPLLALHVSALASRCFANEIQERTLTSLATLPIPPATWFAAKGFGVLRRVLPGLVLIAAALALLIMAIGSEHLMAWTGHPLWSGRLIESVLLATTLPLLFFLAVWFSFVVRRGAALWSLAGTVGLSVVVGRVLRAIDDPATYLFMAILLPGLLFLQAPLCRVLHAHILRRLRVAAAE